ncbi:MAG: hypothetical protein JO264_20185 [Acidisphaera sp.]|nr:hypothetical protein [Acidisphaera sp.]
MRVPFLPTALLIAVLAPLPGHAQRPAAHPHPAARPEGPKALGHFEDWTAATHVEAGQTVCYAFTRAEPGSPGAHGDVVLTVTERPSGRDAVAISAGFTYPPNAQVTVEVDQARLEFYTASRSAFARDGHATVAAFQKGRQAVARSPGPRGTPISQTFALRGFGAAYTAINKVCPPR